MSGYTKLFGSIVGSTIWQECLATKVVFITMLAMSDEDGIVEGSVPGLAHIAGVTIEECEAALLKLSSPDKYSRTPDHEGRRIEAVDGGWLILNRVKYRDKNWQSDKAERHREANRRYYQSKKSYSDNSDNPKSESDGVGDKKEEEKETKKEKTTPSLEPTRIVLRIAQAYPFSTYRDELDIPPIVANTIIGCIDRENDGERVLEYTKRYADSIDDPNKVMSMQKFFSDPQNYRREWRRNGAHHQQISKLDQLRALRQADGQNGEQLGEFNGRRDGSESARDGVPETLR